MFPQANNKQEVVVCLFGLGVGLRDALDDADLLNEAIAIAGDGAPRSGAKDIAREKKDEQEPTADKPKADWKKNTPVSQHQHPSTASTVKECNAGDASNIKVLTSMQNPDT